MGGGPGGQPTHQVVYVNGKPKKKKIMGVNKNTAVGRFYMLTFLCVKTHCYFELFTHEYKLFD